MTVKIIEDSETCNQVYASPHALRKAGREMTLKEDRANSRYDVRAGIILAISKIPSNKYKIYIQNALLDLFSTRVSWNAAVA